MNERIINLDKQICILNPKQAAFYWGEKGVEPVYIYPSKDEKNGQDIIVFVFNRSETYKYYKEWLDRR